MKWPTGLTLLLMAAVSSVVWIAAATAADAQREGRRVTAVPTQALPAAKQRPMQAKRPHHASGNAQGSGRLPQVVDPEQILPVVPRVNGKLMH